MRTFGPSWEIRVRQRGPKFTARLRGRRGGGLLGPFPPLHTSGIFLIHFLAFMESRAPGQVWGWTQVCGKEAWTAHCFSRAGSRGPSSLGHTSCARSGERGLGVGEHSRSLVAGGQPAPLLPPSSQVSPDTLLPFASGNTFCVLSVHLGEEEEEEKGQAARRDQWWVRVTRTEEGGHFGGPLLYDRLLSGGRQETLKARTLWGEPILASLCVCAF